MKKTFLRPYIACHMVESIDGLPDVKRNPYPLTLKGCKAMLSGVLLGNEQDAKDDIMTL